MQQPPLPPSTRTPFSITTKIIALAALIMLIIMGIVMGGSVWLKSQIKENQFTDSQVLKQIVIGNDVLNIPANTMRFKKQRDSVALKKADLVLLWPTGEGYSTAQNKTFQNIGNEPHLIFITLRKRLMQHSMTQRLNPIYKKLFRGPAQQGPAGLIIQPLMAGAGYDGEKLAIENAQPITWVARCQEKQTYIQPTCLRDFLAGQNLSVSYRFPRALLPHWQAIETLVRQKIHAMVLQ